MVAIQETRTENKAQLDSIMIASYNLFKANYLKKYPIAIHETHTEDKDQFDSKRMIPGYDLLGCTNTINITWSHIENTYRRQSRP